MSWVGTCWCILAKELCQPQTAYMYTIWNKSTGNIWRLVALGAPSFIVGYEYKNVLAKRTTVFVAFFVYLEFFAQMAQLEKT